MRNMMHEGYHVWGILCMRNRVSEARASDERCLNLSKSSVFIEDMG